VSHIVLDDTSGSDEGLIISNCLTYREGATHVDSSKFILDGLEGSFDAVF
jgi:hypothetical protein